MSTSATKDFQKKIALLRKRQLAFTKKTIKQGAGISSKTGKPTRYAKDLVKRIEKSGLLENRAHVQKVTKEEAKILKDRGYIVTNNRVVLPSTIERGERLERIPGQKHRSIHYFGEEGEGFKDLIEVQNWEQYLEYMRNQWKDFQANGYSLAFRFYGHLSRDTYQDIDTALNYLGQYKAKNVDVSSLNPSDLQDIIQHIDIYKTHRDTWAKADEKRRSKRKRKPRPYRIRMAKILEKEGRKTYQMRIEQENKKRSERRKRKKK